MAAGTVQALRPFVPAADFAASKRFYLDLGFELGHDAADLALFVLGGLSFFLQNFQAPGLAKNFVVQLSVDDVDAWWSKIEALDLVARYAVRAPQAPRAMPWGARVLFLFDPSGVLWHISQFKRD